MKKERLDILVLSRGICQSRERAKAEILSGRIYVDGKPALKPGAVYDDEALIELRGQPMSFVSRGGLKLQKALNEFSIPVDGKICIDCGASTGGFTDCLLRHGAKKVYAVDVGSAQLSPVLRSDARVVNMEKTNLRYLRPGDIPDIVSLAVMDLSFISLSLVLPAVRDLVCNGGDIVCLVKPQFEAGRDKVGKNGVVRDPVVQRGVLDAFIACAISLGLSTVGLSWSPVRGQEGNIEYLCHLKKGGESRGFDTAAIVTASHDELK